MREDVALPGAEWAGRRGPGQVVERVAPGSGAPVGVQVLGLLGVPPGRRGVTEQVGASGQVPGRRTPPDRDA